MPQALLAVGAVGARLCSSPSSEGSWGLLGLRPQRDPLPAAETRLRRNVRPLAHPFPLLLSLCEMLKRGEEKKPKKKPSCLWPIQGGRELETVSLKC